MCLKGQPTQLLSEVDQGSTYAEGQIFLKNKLGVYTCSRRHYSL